MVQVLEVLGASLLVTGFFRSLDEGGRFVFLLLGWILVIAFWFALWYLGILGEVLKIFKIVYDSI